ncbi:hypothetical protein NL676_013674 [Syzygium grande]|nr:hypothetical protein NL676_013674 [Syzygium grande]
MGGQDPLVGWPEDAMNASPMPNRKFLPHQLTKLFQRRERFKTQIQAHLVGKEALTANCYREFDWLGTSIKAPNGEASEAI